MLVSLGILCMYTALIKEVTVCSCIQVYKTWYGQWIDIFIYIV